MDFIKTVKNRKATRKFRPDKISDSIIKKILETVNLAPSAGNLQAYKIFVVKDKQKKKELAEACFYQNFISGAPLVLVFCANPEESARKYGERGRRLYAFQDATIAASFSTLIATNFGLSSCWVGAFNDKGVQDVLETALFPIAVVPVGYPAENPERPERKRLTEIVKIL